MSDIVITFGELTPEQRYPAGGKGGALAQLYQMAYPVPDGLVVLPAAFDGDELSPEGGRQVQAHLARLGADADRGAFAIRSSALVEDSARASFAGEFETVLDMRGDEAVLAAIHTVRRSRHSERVRAYSEARGLDVAHQDGADRDGGEMAVVVQRMVAAEISGVLFSADPVTGGRDRMVGNYVHGLGESLVSGELAPHEFTLARPRGRYQGPPELKRFARRLYRLAMRLERDLGGPQDIEWAISRGKITLLQSRPITTLMGFDPVTGEFNDSLTGDFVWSCVNVGEAMSMVMTPFTWSLLHGAYSELDILPGYSSLGNIGGRPYQNVTVMMSMFRALGRNLEDLVKEMGGVRDEYLETMDQYLFPLPDATFFAILPKVIPMMRKQRAGLKNLEPFLAENPRWCRDVCRRIEGMRTADELASIVGDELMPVLRQTFWRVVGTVWRYSELAGRLRRELTALVGAADADTLLSNVSSEDELLASMGPVVGLAKVARGEMSSAAYLEQWGHRGALETETYIPRPFEDPGWLDRQLAAFVRSPVDVDALLGAQRAKFEAAWDRFRERHPLKARSVRRRLERAAGAARMREAVRSEFTRLAWVARTWVLRVGDLTDIGDGAFFLSFDELLDLLAGVVVPASTILARRGTYERYQALPLYPTVIRGRFDPFRWAADPNRRSDVFDSHGFLSEIKLVAASENVILGMPGSAGRVEGVVRCLDSPERGDELETGEILVTSQTNIGWTLLFPRVGAVVTDIGAPLSHAAIVARELGIPAVVNCGDATMRLRTGDRVRVDGVQGSVEILDSIHI